MKLHGNAGLFLLLVAGYLLSLSVAVGAAYYARQQALQNFSSAEARQEWNDWREAARQQAKAGPIQRRLPKSEEAPSLVLFRDYFGVVLAAAVVFGSALYAIFAFFLYGLWIKPASAARQRS
jgi:hypothetical protein